MNIPKSDNSPILLAWTRVSGAQPHLWTYYGWASQLNKVAINGRMKVVVLVCDQQSWDIGHAHMKSFLDIKGKLLENLYRILEPNILVLEESRLPRMADLWLILGSLCTPSMLNRISVIKWQKKDGISPSLSTLLYPAMMTANMMGIGATHMFNRPEATFQPIDIMNQISAKVNHIFSLNTPKFQIVPKWEIFIPSVDGSWPMKREKNELWVIEISRNREYLQSCLHKSLHNQSQDPMYVIKCIWKVVAPTEPLPESTFDVIISQLVEKIIASLPKNLEAISTYTPNRKEEKEEYEKIDHNVSALLSSIYLQYG